MVMSNANKLRKGAAARSGAGKVSGRQNLEIGKCLGILREQEQEFKIPKGSPYMRYLEKFSGGRKAEELAQAVNFMRCYAELGRGGIRSKLMPKEVKLFIRESIRNNMSAKDIIATIIKDAKKAAPSATSEAKGTATAEKKIEKPIPLEKDMDLDAAGRQLTFDANEIEIARKNIERAKQLRAEREELRAKMGEQEKNLKGNLAKVEQLENTVKNLGGGVKKAEELLKQTLKKKEERKKIKEVYRRKLEKLESGRTTALSANREETEEAARQGVDSVHETLRNAGVPPRRKGLVAWLGGLFGF